MLGSKYLKTIHDADVPMLAIKHPEHEFVLLDKLTLRLNRALCPCDLTFSHQAVFVAADACRHFNAELFLVHIVHSYKKYVAMEDLPGEPAPEIHTQRCSITCSSPTLISDHAS